MTRIFIGDNYFGAGNFGDDLMLAGFLDVAARYPGTEISVCTPHERASQQRRFPQVRWLPESDAIRDDAIRNADLWLGLGDTPFQLDSGPWMLEHIERELQRCRTFGTPMYLLGVGCESAAAVADSRSQALLAAAEHVWARDEWCATVMAPFVAAARLSIGADLAHLAFTVEASAPAPEPDVLGLLLAFERREQFDLGELETFLARRTSGGTRWLVQEVRTLRYAERWILAHLSDEMRSRLQVTDLDYARAPVAEYLAAFGAPGVTVTSRYHGALTAAWHGSKVLAVSRSGKVRGIAEQLGLAHVADVCTHAALEAAIGSAAAVPRDRLRALRDRARIMCESFFDRCASRNGAIAAPRAATARRGPSASHPLPFDAMRVTIDAAVPSSLAAGQMAAMACSLTNRGTTTYVSAPPNPVQLCYRWYDAGGAPHGGGTWIHTALPRPLDPGETIDTTMRVAAPIAPGTYALAITLLQEHVAWFDDLDPANGVRAAVTIEPGDEELPAIEPFFRLSAGERRTLTLQAIETRTPLLLRWNRTFENWQDEWAYRAALAAEWLSSASSVADLGCGSMTLERHLLPSQRYIPSDIVARDSRTIVLDLEKDDVAPAAADACALLGVIGYLFDVPAVLAKLRAVFPRVVLSYHVCPPGDVESRLENGWVNHFSYDEVVALLRDAGYAVVRECVIDGNQYLFELAATG